MGFHRNPLLTLAYLLGLLLDPVAATVTAGSFQGNNVCPASDYLQQNHRFFFIELRADHVIILDSTRPSTPAIHLLTNQMPSLVFATPTLSKHTTLATAKGSPKPPASQWRI